MYQLSPFEEEICKEIVDSAFTVHKALGPGLLERIYESCFCHELISRGINLERHVSVPIKYNGHVFDDAFRIDLFIERSIICELKAVAEILPVWKAQLLSYLKLTRLNVGFLINFNVVLMKEGIRRMCLDT
jgi:GxxExxY protein